MAVVETRVTTGSVLSVQYKECLVTVESNRRGGESREGAE